MRITDIPILLLPFLTPALVYAEPRFPTPKLMPHALEALLMEPTPSSASISSTPTPTPTPFLKHLDLREAAAAQPAAAPAAPAPAVAPAVAPAAAPAPAAAAPVAPAAPAAGVGGAGAAPAAAQPQPGAQANSVTTIQVNTVIKGVATVVPLVYTQTFADARSAVPVKTGTIGLGTLTGTVGVVKTKNAKSDAVAVGKRIPMAEVLVVLVAGVAAMGGGAFGIARL